MKSDVCPYCGRELETGKIVAGNRIEWIPEEKKSFLSKIIRADAIELCGNPFFENPSVPAWLCRSCGKLIVDVPADTVQYKSDES